MYWRNLSPLGLFCKDDYSKWKILEEAVLLSFGRSGLLGGELAQNQVGWSAANRGWTCKGNFVCLG